MMEEYTYQQYQESADALRQKLGGSIRMRAGRFRMLPIPSRCCACWARRRCWSPTPPAR